MPGAPETPTDSIFEDSAPISGQGKNGKELIDLAAEIRRLEKENRILRRMYQPENQNENTLPHASKDTLPHTSSTSLYMLQHQLDTLAETIRQFTHGQSKTNTVVPPQSGPATRQSTHRTPPLQSAPNVLFVIMQPPVSPLSIRVQNLSVGRKGL